MFVILTILSILMLISKARYLKQVFLTKEEDIILVKRTFNNITMDSRHRWVIKIGWLLFCLLYIIYYALSAIYVNNVVFTAISITLIVICIIEMVRHFITILQNAIGYKGSSTVYRVLCNFLFDTFFAILVLAVIIYRVFISLF